MKRRIVYVPTYWYLSDPVFFNVVRCARDRFCNIYFSTMNPALHGYDERKRHEVRKYFDEYHEIGDRLFWDLPNTPSLLGKSIRLLKGIVTGFKAKLEKQLDGLRPDAILTTSDLGEGPARIIHAWAERKGMPFIVIQPSFINLRRVRQTLRHRLYYLLFDKILRFPLVTRQGVFGDESQRDHLFLWGEYFRKCYEALGIERNFYLTGNPAFDPILNGETRSDDPGIDLPQGTPVITICTQPLETLIGERGVREVDGFYRFAIADNPDVYFVIKLHPRNDIERYRREFADLDATNFTIVKGTDLHSLFRTSDVQVSVNSFTSFEAVVFGVPIVLVDPQGITRDPDFFNNEIELRANTPEEFSRHLRRCLTEEYKELFKPKRETYLQPRLGFLDGRSGERVVQKIEQIVGR